MTMVSMSELGLDIFSIFYIHFRSSLYIKRQGVGIGWNFYKFPGSEQLSSMIFKHQMHFAEGC